VTYTTPIARRRSRISWRRRWRGNRTVTTPKGTERTLHLHAALAEHERKVISERAIAALAAAKARGQALGNPKLAEARAIANANHIAGAEAFADSVAPAIRGAGRHAQAPHDPVGQLGFQRRSPSALRGRVLPARPGREPHQILEDPPGGRPHVMHQGQRQPTAAVPARRLSRRHSAPFIRPNGFY
jgi:hypothetical protein